MLTTSRLAVTLLLGAEGARCGRAAHGELRDVRRGGVQGAGRRHRHVPVEADASVGEAGQQRAVFLADRYQGSSGSGGSAAGASPRRWWR